MIAPLLFLAAAASAPAAGSPPVPAAPPPAAAPSAARPLPRCLLTPGAQFALHLTGATGSHLDIKPEGPVALKNFALYKADLLRDGTREYNVEIDWIETVEAGTAGGYRLLRKITAAKVSRTTSGVAENGPLPIDYEGAVATIELDARCAVISRKFASSRLPKPEQETLAQMLAQEPMAAPPETLPASGEFVRESGSPPAFITDRYTLAPPGSAAEGARAGDGLRLQLLRSVAIRDESNPQFVPLSSPRPGVYSLDWCGDGLPRAIQGGYELAMRESLDAPPELVAPPEKNNKQEGTEHSSPAPASAPPPAARIIIDYHLPSTFALTRRPLNAAAKQGGACP